MSRTTSRRPRLYLFLVVSFALGAVAVAVCASPATVLTDGSASTYLDLLDLHGSPASPTDRGFNIFFDAGSWHGYSLPPQDAPTTGFVGPFLHDLGTGRWVGRRFAELSLRDAKTGHSIALQPMASHSAPGYLIRHFRAGDLAVRETLFFADSRHTRVRIRLTTTRTRQIKLAIIGQALTTPDARLRTGPGAVIRSFGAFPGKLVTRAQVGHAQALASVNGMDYRLAFANALSVMPGHPVVVRIDQAVVPKAARLADVRIEHTRAWSANRQRWAGYLKAVAGAHLTGIPDVTARRVAVKAVETLLGNWRAPRGDIYHAGVIPSYSNPGFNGFWAWDSWKHAAALALFAPRLARSQILAMFDYQRANGMIPDCIFIDKANDNWRDTKPPLATWAVMAVYRATGDKAFLARMYPKLVRYHRWWYTHRDHNHDGLAEYGSTDGTGIAAKWESGMDNAVRFDHIKMLRNGPHAWSMDQASADLNAYLYGEDKGLAQAAAILGKSDAQQHWQAKAAMLKHLIDIRLFDAKAGYFFDRKMSGDLVKVYGSDGWIPLWTGAATAAQARGVAKIMMDPARFNTFMPLPTLSRGNPHFSPVRGYWRGPIWVDQALFGIEGLRRYGFTRDATELAKRLVTHAQGLTAQATFRENYDPLSGHGYQSRNFSWSAASYLLLLDGQARHQQEQAPHVAERER